VVLAYRYLVWVETFASVSLNTESPLGLELNLSSSKKLMVTKIPAHPSIPTILIQTFSTNAGRIGTLPTTFSDDSG